MVEVKHELSALKKLPRRLKIALFIILSLFFTFGFVLGVFLQKKTLSAEPPRTSPLAAIPSPTVRPRSSLVIAPATATVKVGETISLAVVLSGEPVQGVDIVLEYDPAVFLAKEIEPSDMFPFILRKKVDRGKIAFTASLTPGAPEATKTGEIFRIDLESIGATESAIVDFNREKTVAAADGKNILEKTVGGKYAIQE